MGNKWMPNNSFFLHFNHLIESYLHFALILLQNVSMIQFDLSFIKLDVFYHNYGGLQIR